MKYYKVNQLLFDCLCILCKNKELSKEVPYLCRKCLNKFKIIKNSLCNVCGHPLNDYMQCISCNKLGNIYFDSYKFIQFYSDFFKNVIYKLKREEDFMINRLFFDLILLSNFIKDDGIITVVPDTFYKIFKKGRSGLKYLLELFEVKGYKVVYNIYKKKGGIFNSQKSKSQKERIDEIKKLYYLPPTNISKYEGKVYLIDDVYTTGATLNYGAKLLKQAGFNNVVAVSFFRAVFNN